MRQSSPLNHYNLRNLQRQISFEQLKIHNNVTTKKVTENATPLKNFAINERTQKLREAELIAEQSQK